MDRREWRQMQWWIAGFSEDSFQGAVQRFRLFALISKERYRGFRGRQAKNLRTSLTVFDDGLYSNKTRGQQPLIPDRIIRPPKTDPPPKTPPAEILLVPAPPKQSARDMRSLWRDLILKVWGGDPLECPCCKAPMKLAGAVKRPEQVEKRRRLVGVLDRNPRSG
jgi:hypothetical protein